MNRNDVRDQLISILNQVQESVEDSPVVITGVTCPLADVPGLDSKVLPAVTAMLAEALGLPIPNETNIFASASGQALNVDQIVEKVYALAERQQTVA